LLKYKSKIIKKMKKRQFLVEVVGDGVNDEPDLS
jgi:cation transport ATPase